MAIAAETEERRRFAESLVKTLTGGEDKLMGRRMREDFWEFKATHKLWITGNHKPRVSSTDEAIWDRFRIIPFNVRFEKPDRKLPKKLEGELPGILNWALRGCRYWIQEGGLITPTAVKEATVNYRQEMNSIGAFLLDRHDPSKVIGRLREPLLKPNENEREGYVPNVVYTCGGMIHGGRLILPYAVSDSATSFAIVALDELLGAMK